DGKAVCPLHLWDFDLRTGMSPFNPADHIPVYRARVVDGVVEVDADSVPRGPGRPDVYLGPWARRGAMDRGMYVVHHLAAGPGPLPTSSRWPRGTSAGRRRPSPPPTPSRSRSARAPSPDWVACCRDPRSPARSPPCGACRRGGTPTPRRASPTSTRWTT